MRRPPSPLSFVSVVLSALALVAIPATVAASPPSASVAVPATPALPADARARLRAEVGPRASFESRPGFAGIFMATGMRSHPRTGSPSEVARGFVREHGAAFGVGGAVELAIESERVANAIGYVRMRRMVHGEPVAGESMVVRVLPGGIVDHVTARLSDLPIDPGARVIDVAEASTRALVAARRTVVESSRPIRAPREGAIVPAWEIVVAGSATEDRYAVYLDARDGAPIGGRFMTLHATGRVYDPNPAVAMMRTTDSELAYLTSREHLTGRYIRAQNCVSQSGDCQEMQVATADVDGNFLYDPVEPSFDDPFAEVMAYFHGNRVAAYFRETHEFEWRCSGASTSVMPVTVNLHSGTNTPYDNAAYSSGSCSGLVFGQGDDLDFAYDGDVVYHEFTHGVVDQTAGLSGVVAVPWGLSYDPLALNEGTADFFSATVSGDPDLAEYLASSAFGGEFSSRSADNDLRCPNDLFGEGHYDGRIWNATNWDIREAIGAEKTDALVYAALNTFSDAANFDEAGLALLSTAMAFETMGTLSATERETVEGIVGDRGLVDCEGIVPISDGDNKRGYSGSAVFGRFYGNIAPLLYRIDIPPDAHSMILDIRSLTVSGDYSVVITVGRIPRNRGAELRGDVTVDAGELLFDSRSTPPLEPCTTWYIGLVVNDLAEGESLYGLSLNIVRGSELDGGADAPTTCEELDSGVPDAGASDDAGDDTPDADGEMDAGTDDDAGTAMDSGAAADAGPTTGGDDDDGCGCSTPGQPTEGARGWVVGGLLVLGLLVARRRRRN